MSATSDSDLDNLLCHWLLIYDLDDTILAGQPIHQQAWRDAIEAFHGPFQRAGVDLSATRIDEFIEYQCGKTNEQAAAWLTEGKVDAPTAEAFVESKKSAADKRAPEAQVFPDFRAFVEQLVACTNRRVAIVTSSPQGFCRGVLAANPWLAVLVPEHRFIWREKYTDTKVDGLRCAVALEGFAGGKPAYIGDAASDQTVAVEAGCHFVYYLRQGAKRALPEGTPEISDHRELPKALESLRSSPA